ncbi:MAG: alpha-L-arabinofuranosidase [Microbacter sp.]
MQRTSLCKIVLILFSIAGSLNVVACSKLNDVPSSPSATSVDTTVQKAVDPPLDSTIGFFLNDWQSKIYIQPTYNQAALPTTLPTVTVTVDAASVVTKIPLTIFGQNANNWMGPMYNVLPLMTPLTLLNPHVLRFPAGSGSDCFFWNCYQDQPPTDAPVRLRKADGTYQTTNLYTYGKTTNNWQATVDDYYRVLQQTNSVGIITVNYGYARYGTGPHPVQSAAHLAADWVRYDNGRTKYWEIGNENYGDWEWGYRIDTSTNQDGQPEFLTGDLYGRHFKIFADSMRAAAAQIGKTIYIGAVMYESPSQSWMNNTMKTWDATMIPAVGNAADFYIGHNYITPYQQNISAANVLMDASNALAPMMTFMKGQLTQNGIPIKPIVLSEWNMFAQDSMQQVSNVSGGFAVIVQGDAIKNKFGLAARWDLYNGWDQGNDMGLFSAGDEPNVAKWTPRPSYYYMYYFQKTIGDRMVNSNISGSNTIKCYPSTYSSGQASVALVNMSGISQVVQINLKNFRLGNRFYWYSLAGGSDNGNFSRKVFVNGIGPSGVAGGPSNFTEINAFEAPTSNGIKVTLPSWGAVFIMVDTK